MESFVTVISQVGFPIAITAYLLIRFEKKLEKLERTLDNLVKSIEGRDGLIDKIEDIKKVHKK